MKADSKAINLCKKKKQEIFLKKEFLRFNVTKAKAVKVTFLVKL